MKSRAELLAELEEKSQQNKEILVRPDELEVSEAGTGYDPYDNPGVHKQWPDGFDDT